LSVPFGHTTGHDQTRGFLTLSIKGQNRVNRFPPRLINKSTCIDNNKVSVTRRIGGEHAIGKQGTDQFVGVNLILGTTKRFNVEVLHLIGHDI
jgi:hypothetical protein